MCCSQPTRTCVISRIFLDAELRSWFLVSNNGRTFVRMLSALRKRFNRQFPAVIPRSTFRQAQGDRQILTSSEIKSGRCLGLPADSFGSCYEIEVAVAA